MASLISLKRLRRWMPIAILLGLLLWPSEVHGAPSAAISLIDWPDRLRQYLLQSQGAILRLTLRIIYAVVATFVVRFAFRLMRRYYPRLYRFIYRLKDGWIPSVSIQGIELISARSTVRALIFVSRYLRYVLSALIIYLYIPFILNLSPWTRQLGDWLFQALMSGLSGISLSVVSYVPNLITLILILVIAYYLLKLSLRIFSEIERGRLKIPGFYRGWAKPTSKITIFIIAGFAAVVAFPYLPGGSSPALQGISIFAGILISLGSTSVVSNVVSGIVLIYTRAFERGDRVMIGDIMGDVVEEALIVTRIRTVKNKVVTIPNSKVLSSDIVNFSKGSREDRDRPLVVHTTITLGYDVPWRQVHELLKGAARETVYALEQPAPFILQTALNDFYVSYEINLYTHEPLYLEEIQSDLHQHIQDYLNQAGVEIMSPHYAAIRDGGESTIPEGYAGSRQELQRMGVEVFLRQETP